MKIPHKLIAVVVAATFLTVSAFAAEEKKDTPAQTCCEKADAAGKDCSHPCCVAAHKEGKSCAKCNSDKQDEKIMAKKKAAAEKEKK